MYFYVFIFFDTYFFIEGVKLNITAVYTFKQTERILKCLNKKTKSIISIFAGRMADKGKDPLPIFKRSIALTKKYKNIWNSLG